jgi:hypothetical protein
MRCLFLVSNASNMGDCTRLKTRLKARRKLNVDVVATWKEKIAVLSQLQNKRHFLRHVSYNAMPNRSLLDIPR